MIDQTPPRPAPLSGSIILLLGILSIVMMPLLGPFAWVFGNQALAALNAGAMDPSERSNVVAGRICGIVGSVLLGFGAIAGIVWCVFALTMFRAISTQAMKPVGSPPTAVVTVPTGNEPKSLTDAVMMRDAAQVESMIAANPGSVNDTDQAGETPLFTAAFTGSTQIAGILIARGANVNAKDAFGKTPLDNAVFFHRDAVAALLKAHGARRGTGK